MRRLGFVLFLAGLVLAAWYAARPIAPESIEGSGAGGAVTSMDRLAAWGNAAGVPFGIGVVLMIGGGIVARRALRIEARASEMPSGEESDIHNLLREIDEGVAALPTAEPSTCVEALHEQLDRMLEDLIPAFLEQREAVIAHLGLLEYGEMSNSFAMAERALARAWSALTDEAWEEVATCLDAARRAMADAVRLADI